MDLTTPDAAQRKGGRLVEALTGGFRPAVLLLAGYFLLSALVRISLPDSLTLDEAEQSLFSQFWRLGYGPQPPFYNWLQSAVVWVGGISLTTLALPKFLMLLACYAFYGLAAREIDARSGFASLAMLALLTLPQLSYMPQQDLTHTVAVLMATSLFLYGLFRALARSDWQSFLAIGVAVGIGCISKYNFLLLPAAALLALVCDGRWRHRLLDVRILISIGVAALIVLPHSLWLVGNVELASTGTLSKMSATGGPGNVGRMAKAILSLATACLAFGGLAAVVFSVAYRGNLKPALRAGDEWTRLLGRTMLFCLAGVVVVIVATGTAKITERWLDPYLLVLPLYLLLKFERAGVDTVGALPRLFPVFATIMAVTLLIVPGRTLLASVTGSYSRINQPIADIADVIRPGGEPVLILSDSQHLAGNMRLQFPDARVERLEDWQDVLSSSPTGPMLLVWGAGDDEGAAAPAELDAVLQAQGEAGSLPERVTLPYLFSGGKKHYSMSFLRLRR